MTQINVSIYVIVEEKFIYSRSDIPKRSNIMPLNIITLQLTKITKNQYSHHFAVHFDLFQNRLSQIIHQHLVSPLVSSARNSFKNAAPTFDFTALPQ